jgi:hypothetical protein
MRVVAYGITSLPRERASARRLLALTRRHWGIEAWFHIRDVTFGEDACRVRSGAAPLILSAMRNLVAQVLRRHWQNLSAALRHYAARAFDALRLFSP